jgi:hypothetical protein
LLYPSCQNVANVVVEERNALRHQHIQLFDHDVYVNQGFRRTTKYIEQNRPSEGVVEYVDTFLQCDDAELDLLQNLFHLLWVQLSSSFRYV